MATRTTYSFEEFYNELVNKYNELSDSPSFFGRSSKIRALFRAIAHFFTLMQLQVNITYNSVFIRFAKALHLERLIGNFGMSRINSTNALVYQTFLGDTGRNTDVTIPANTQVSREPDYFDQTVYYTLIEDVILPSGSAAVTGACVCNDIGTIGNTPSGTITVLVDTITGVSGTINYEEVTNGANRETDNQVKERVPNYLLGLQSGNVYSILNAVYSIPNVVYANIKENTPSEGNFTIYVVSETGTIDSVQAERIRNAINSVKDICVTYSLITPINQFITLEFDLELHPNITTNEETAYLLYIKTAIQNYINTLNGNKLYRSSIIKLVTGLKNIVNIKNVKINGTEQDLESDPIYKNKVNSINDITINLI